jgi:hypothetical protein
MIVRPEFTLAKAILKSKKNTAAYALKFKLRQKQEKTRRVKHPAGKRRKSASLREYPSLAVDRLQVLK